MAFYSTYWYSIYEMEYYLYVTLVICCIMLCLYPSYIMCEDRLVDLSHDIGSLCLQACSSSLLVHPKGGRPGGARVVIFCMGMVLGYDKNLQIWLCPTVLRGRPQVVTALSFLELPHVRVWHRSYESYNAIGRPLQDSLPVCLGA
jgi:hypothetical protein